MAVRVIKVFIASPGDLTIERRAFKDVIDELNKGFGRGAEVQFEPLGWEDALSQFGRRSQSVINKDIDACDVFVLVMWRRWGQEAPDAAPYSSYTEEEFYRAVTRFEKNQSPTIFAFFKHIDSGQIADPGEQLKKVLEFRKKLEQSRKALWRGFADEAEFKAEIDKHLCAFAKGQTENINETVIGPLLPDSVITEMEKIKAEAKRNLERAEKAEQDAKDAIAKAEAVGNVAEAKAAKQSVSLAESAAKAALDGKLEEARQVFAKALDGTTNLRVLYLGYEFFARLGEIDEAERLLRRWLSITGPESQTAETAAAYGNLGNIESTRGNLDTAEDYLKKALAFNEKIGRIDGMAIQYGNLGIIEGTRGNLDAAEDYFKKALTLDEILGKIEGMASDYNNLGSIERTRGNLDAAEAYHKKALGINEKLGLLEGTAITYGNLGNVENTRGNLDAAETYYKKALALNNKLGRIEGMAIQYGNLGIIESTRGNLDAAEDYLHKALVLDEKLGRIEGMASTYSNLGNIESMRGNTLEASRLWVLARDLFRKVGVKPMEQLVQALLDSLDVEKAKTSP